MKAMSVWSLFKTASFFAIFFMNVKDKALSFLLVKNMVKDSSYIKV